MKHFAGLLLFAAFVPGAYAQSQVQSQTPASAAASIAAASKIEPGVYAGSVKQQGGKRSSDVKMTIKDVTTDGRITATVAASHPRAACAKSLPMNGIVLPEGLMRLTVDDGVPKGCERVYHLKVAQGGTLSGTYFAGRTAPKTSTTR